MLKKISKAILLIGAFIMMNQALAQDQLITYTKGNQVIVTDGENQLFNISPMFWGPGWKFGGVGGEFMRQDGIANLEYDGQIRNSETKYKLDFKVSAEDDMLELDYTISTPDGGDIQLMAIGIEPHTRYKGENAASVMNNDETTSVSMPLPGQTGLGKNVRQIVFGIGGDDTVSIDFGQAQNVMSDGGAFRSIIAADKIEAGQTNIKMIVKLPRATVFYAEKSEIPKPDNWNDWFQWRADSDATQDSVIGMSDWIEAPAGKHGWVQMAGDKLIYNGKPLQIWGLNNTYGACIPKKELADKRAEFYVKYGINGMRLHKLADNAAPRGIQSNDSIVEFDPEALDRMDYYVAKMKEKGIYTKISMALGWGLPIGPGDKKYVPYMDEFGEMKKKGKAPRINPGHGAIFWSPEMQKVKILQLTNLLNHTNPYTGLRYAEDPAVFLVEMTNEESIYWYTTMRTLLQHRPFRDYNAKLFALWLKEKYKTKESLVAAWGEGGLNTFEETQDFPESWEDDYIIPLGNIWFFDPANLDGSQAFRKPRLLDTMAFLYEIQTNFYKDFAKAIRDTGYKGLMETSNWQAGRNMSHYYNLHTDYQIGLIDRHNYSGGKTMLRVPGSSIFSAGMQQVADRPFSLSEWMRTPPSLLGLDGPAIISAYGFGLNGWDISFAFQNGDDGEFSSRLFPQTWDVTAPHFLGLFPAVARQIYRNDIAESEVLAKRNVYVPELAEGKLGFNDTVEQEHDVKSLNSDKVPAESMAVARAVVDFVDEPTPTPEFNLDKYIEDGTYVSSTGQLRWTPMESLERQGYFTINTDATKAVVGFAKDTECKLGDVTITPRTDFAAIYVTALGRDGKLDTQNRWLITTIARTMNKDMIYLHRDILQRGNGPIMMQPVAVELELPADATVNILDHDGRPTGKTVGGKSKSIRLNGADTKAVYYEVVF